jgi:hypothetical protein
MAAAPFATNGAEWQVEIVMNDEHVSGKNPE